MMVVTRKSFIALAGGIALALTLTIQVDARPAQIALLMDPPINSTDSTSSSKIHRTSSRSHSQPHSTRASKSNKTSKEGETFSNQDQSSKVSAKNSSSHSFPKATTKKVESTSPNGEKSDKEKTSKHHNDEQGAVKGDLTKSSDSDDEKSNSTTKPANLSSDSDNKKGTGSQDSKSQASGENGQSDEEEDGAVWGSKSNSTLSGKNGKASSVNPLAMIPRTRFCGTRDNTNKTISALTRQLTKERKTKLEQISKDGVLVAQKKQVDIVWHVTHDGNDGNLGNDAIQGQISELNSAYSNFGFSFTLANTTRSDNATWFRQVTSGNSLEREMKQALRTGDAKTLNLYSVQFPDNLLGYATFPFDYENDPSEDGVVFLYSTVPGGDASGYNQGKTAVHEIGHWLGLFHTFQGGCSGNGDDVDDTPPQASPTSGCPTGKDTCKGDNFADPIHNYMDYSSDACLNQFTQGQAVRMDALTSHYRRL